MGTSVITDTLTDPTGAVVATSSGVAINIRLMSAAGEVGGFRISDGTEVASVTAIDASTSGTFSVSLENNSNIDPGGTFYVVEAINPSSYGGARDWSILSSSSVSPQNLHDALVSAIPSYVPPTTVPPTILSGNNTFTGTNTFNGDVFFGSGIPEYDLEAFGAIGNGSTTNAALDTAALNTIFAQVSAGSATGAIIKGAPGARYVFDDVLWPIKKIVWLKGSGGSPTDQLNTGAGVTSSLHIGTGTNFDAAGTDAGHNWTNGKITDWDFDSAGAGTNCFRVAAGYNWEWDNVRIHNFSATGAAGVFFDGENSQSCWIKKNCSFDRNFYNVRILGGTASADQTTKITVEGTMDLPVSACVDADLTSSLTLNCVGTHASNTAFYNLRGVTNFDVWGHSEMSGSTGLAWSWIIDESTQNGAQSLGGRVGGTIVRNNQTSGTANCLNLLSCKGVQVDGYQFSNNTGVGMSTIGPVSLGSGSEASFGEGTWNGATTPLVAVNSAATGMSAAFIDFIPYRFVAVDVVAGATGHLAVAGTTGVPFQPIPRNSWLVGVGYAAGSGISAGTVTLYPNLGSGYSTYSLTATSSTPDSASQMRAPLIGGSSVERVAAGGNMTLDFVATGGYTGPSVIAGTIWLAQNNHVTNKMF